MSLCTHCNAPLPHGQIRCAYCGAANDLDLSGRHYYTTHAHGQARTCPACHVPMATLDIGVGQAPFLVERCPKCLGLFFDPGELDSLVRETVQGVYSIDPLRLTALRESAPPGPEKICYRPCPVCGKLMNRQNFGERSGIIVDRCRDHGVYLDGGELQRICLWVRSGGALQATQQKSAEPVRPLPRVDSDSPEENNDFHEIRAALLALVQILRRIF